MQHLILKFSWQKLHRKMPDGTTHQVYASVKLPGGHGEALTLIHHAVCEKEARDVAEGLTSALSWNAYQFDHA